MSNIPRMTEEQLQEILGRCPKYLQAWVQETRPDDIPPLVWWRSFGLKTRFAVALVHLEATVRHLQAQIRTLEETLEFKS